MAEEAHGRGCPRCPGTGLKLRDFVIEQVDVCPGCGGMFFERGELENLNLLVEDFFSVNLAEPEIENLPDAERDFKPDCPGCGAKMMPHQVGQVWIDQCSGCEGFWLDADEVGALRVSQLIIRQNLNLFLRLSQ
tara:strand:+ start:120 stop:521 length:402 start_codon:yes stop_codon:yes gene_type:complete